DSLPVRTTTPDLLDMERVKTHLALAVERGRYRGPTDALDYLLHRQCLVRVGAALRMRLGDMPDKALAIVGVPQNTICNRCLRNHIGSAALDRDDPRRERMLVQLAPGRDIRATVAGFFAARRHIYHR
ncbi:MAG: hypothetical protein HC876_22475, partial [Chloroflexaceae bacterium]|nr:hypothetical protein [Chloroflexaceae bacterium]